MYMLEDSTILQQLFADFSLGGTLSVIAIE
jgi:hypothetical protein